MLTHPLLEKLDSLSCRGMSEALREQLSEPEIQLLSFDERLSLLTDREWWVRQNRRNSARLRSAGLRQNACIEDIDYSHSRGLSRMVMQKLGSCQWVREKQNIILTGPTGTGKSFIACALSHRACLEGFTAKYLRLPRLFQDMSISKGDGQYFQLLKKLSKVNVLILDDWGLSPMSGEQGRDLLEILEDRQYVGSTIVTSQLPLKHWHDSIGDSTLADAILDRLVHNANKIELLGESMRKKINIVETLDIDEKKD